MYKTFVTLMEYHRFKIFNHYFVLMELNYLGKKIKCFMQKNMVM
jgi:hypothetical protein